MSLDPASRRSGSAAAFSVTLECKITRTLIAGGQRRAIQMVYEGAGANRTFTTNQATYIPIYKVEVREVLRNLMRSVKPLQDLNLTDRMWEDILPESSIPLLMELARGA